MKPGRNFYKYLILTAFSGLLIVLLCIAPTVREPVELIIYDVHTDSPRIVKDDGSIEFADHVRIRNISDHSIDLTGLFLSDSGKNLRKLPLDGVVIAAGDSQMIKLDPSWNFALKSTNEESVYLSDGRGGILYKYTPNMRPDAPEFSAGSGFYEDEFYLKISARGTQKIYYTLDGSVPDTDSPVYTEPIRVYDRSGEPNSVVNVPNIIKHYLEKEYYNEDSDSMVPVEQPTDDPVDKAFIVRAAAIDGYGNSSDIVTGVYFFCGRKYRNIMSIVADPDDLFGDYGIVSTGIEYDEWYENGGEGDVPTVNYNKKGREWEVPASVEYFRGTQKVMSEKCGLRLQGRTTRDRRIKNFQLFARNCYSGSDVFSYNFFENEEYLQDRVVLDDCFRESVFYSLVENENIIKPKTTERVALFINGEFWNNVYIRQRIDEKYFADHCGIREDNLLVIAETFPEIGADDDETFDAMRQLYLAIDEYAENTDLSIPANYDKICTMMDIGTYIDYLAINAWVGCGDWGEYNNDMCWRVKTVDASPYGDGKFRWMLHDGDDVFNRGFLITNNETVNDSVLYRGLLKNEDFRKKLGERMRQLGNTAFSEDNVRAEFAGDKWDEPERQEIIDFFSDRREVMEEMITKDFD